jgi:flagellar biosynthesis/type III secretory pathway ATPase
MRKVRESMAAYRRAEDLINLGAYAAGSNPLLDAAIRTRASLEQFLKQTPEEKINREGTLTKLTALAAELG